MFNLTTITEKAGKQSDSQRLAVLRWNETPLFAADDFKMAGDALAIADEWIIGRDTEDPDIIREVAATAVNARWQHPSQDVYRVYEGKTLIQVFDRSELMEVSQCA